VRSGNHCCSRKAMSITQPKCVYLWRKVSSMQCACAILPSVACPDLQYFSTLSHKRYDFRKKNTEHNMYVLIFSTTFFSETFLILRRNERYMTKNVYLSSHKVPFILVRF
jgi:hypothetical protein